MSETAVKERGLLRVQVMFGLSGGGFEFTLDLDDYNDVTKKITDITELMKRPLVGQINELSKENESLKKRVLSADEIQRLIGVLKMHPNEMRFDGRPTNDDLLVSKLEGMLKD